MDDLNAKMSNVAIEGIIGGMGYKVNRNGELQMEFSQKKA